MATPPPSPRPAHPANIALHHRLSKTPDTASAWRLFEREFERFQQIIKTCHESIVMDERGRPRITPDASNMLNKFGTIYTHFFAAVSLKIRGDLTEEQCKQLDRASLTARTYV